MKLKRWIVLSIVCSMILSNLSGCGSSAKINGESLTIWAEPSTVKYTQDDQEAHKSAHDKKVLEVNMGKNEAEAVQLMMYAKKDVKDYTVEVSDLTYDKEIIKAEDIKVYMAKYQTVVTIQSTPNTAFPVGSKVPDPLLPMETAIEYDENVIAKGNNQVVFFDISTSKDTVPGTYEGKVTLRVGREKYQMPMKVTVHDVEIPDTPELKTAFPWFDRDNFSNGELDSSDKMTTTYFETLLEYNMGSTLPFEGAGGIEKYLELLKKYYDWPGFTAYRMYYDPTGAIYEGKVAKYNVPLLKDYIYAIAELSVEEQKNYLDKAYCYFYTVADEPNDDEMFSASRDMIALYTECIKDCDAELRYKYAGTEKYDYYVNTISKSVLGLPAILPGGIMTEYMDEYNLHDITMCPAIHAFHTEASRQEAKEGREDMQLWTYTCNAPTYPYPTSHADDYNLGFRLTSWMCCDYDFDGFLQWRSVAYRGGSFGGNVLEDAWENMDPSSGRAGEGAYFYPGEKYGLDAPCPGIRAVIYRDGTEDYGVLKAIEAIYEEQGLDSSYALDDLYAQVYTGVIPITDSYLFEEVRLQLFALYDELKSDVGVLYQNVKVDIDSAELEFRTVSEKATITIDGKEAKADKDGVYRVTVDLKEQSTCKIEVTCGKNKKEYTKVFVDGTLGVVNEFEDNATIENSFTLSDKIGTVTYNSDTAKVYEGNGSLGITLNQEKDAVLPYFAIEKNSELIGGSFNEISVVKFYAYNAGAEDVKMDIAYFTDAEVTLQTSALPAGEWTLIQIEIPSDVQDIQELDFNFEEGSSAEIYIDNLVTIVKGENK